MFLNLKKLFCTRKRLIPKKLNEENEQKVTAFILFITVNEKIILGVRNTWNESYLLTKNPFIKL